MPAEFFALANACPPVVVKSDDFRHNRLVEMKRGRRITKAEARAFRKRWEAVNAATREEVRKMPVGRKLQQLATLMAWGRRFGWAEVQAAEEADVRERWNRLLRIYLA